MPKPVSNVPRKPTAPAAPKVYKTVAGDTLDSISKKTGYSAEVLLKLNTAQFPQLETGVISAGLALKLPLGKPTKTPAKPEWAPKSNDKVLFVAMNNSYEHRSTDEADALKGRGVNLTVIKDSETPDVISLAPALGKAPIPFDLTKPEGVTAWALQLKLPADQTKAIADVISSAGADSKDELAQIAMVWATAERGGQPPSRLILSGHHVGYGVYGENNGRLSWPVVAKLAEAMPKGARSVEDLMIAGCYSGGQQLMDMYGTMFPNVKTIVAYVGSSPGASSGAVPHQKRWEQATRGTKEDIDRAIFEGTRKGENVAVWTKAHGLQDGQSPRSVDSLRTDVTNAESAFTAAFSGEATIPNTQEGPVRSYYNYVQRLIQHPDTPAAERAALEARRDQTIRLLFYPVVATKFADAYTMDITRGFESLNLPVPDFRTLSRKDALAAIANFNDAFQAANPVPDNALILMDRLMQFKDLDPAVIPDTWV